MKVYAPSTRDDVSSPPFFFEVLVYGHGREPMIWAKYLSL
jgi:hypothetical protein